MNTKKGIPDVDVYFYLDFDNLSFFIISIPDLSFVFKLSSVCCKDILYLANLQRNSNTVHIYNYNSRHSLNTFHSKAVKSLMDYYLSNNTNVRVYIPTNNSLIIRQYKCIFSHIFNINLL